MKQLPEVNASFADLYGMLIAPIRSKLMLAGIELGVFNHLSEPKTADAVAATIGSHPENTRLFLDGLAACDLVTKKDGTYRNTITAQEFLVEGSQTYLGEMFAFWAQFFTLDKLPKRIREGPPPTPEADMGSEEMYAQVAATLANSERACAQQVVEIISELPEFLSFKKMLDLGGGPGLIGIAIVVAHPGMNGIIFDLPSVVKVSETFIREYEMENRMGVLGGDFTRDSIGEGYDLIWAGGCLYYGKEDMDSLMKKIYEALNPGGIFISHHEGLIHERTGPDLMALSWLPMALMGQDMGFDQGFIANSMLRVGFKSVRSRTVDTPMGPMDLDIGRKAKILK